MIQSCLASSHCIRLSPEPRPVYMCSPIAEEGSVHHCLSPKCLARMSVFEECQAASCHSLYQTRNEGTWRSCGGTDGSAARVGVSNLLVSSLSISLYPSLPFTLAHSLPLYIKNTHLDSSVPLPLARTHSIYIYIYISLSLSCPCISICTLCVLPCLYHTLFPLPSLDLANYSGEVHPSYSLNHILETLRSGRG